MTTSVLELHFSGGTAVLPHSSAQETRLLVKVLAQKGD